MEAIGFVLLLGGAIALFIVMMNMSRHPPSAVEAFNQMAEESMRTRSAIEWALRIGVVIGTMAALMLFSGLDDERGLPPPTDIVIPLAVIGGAVCGLALWYYFLRRERRR